MAKGSSSLNVRRAYEPAAQGDGARVLVDRLWPRGLRKRDAELTLWLKEIAPTPELRKWFGHDPARWTEFSRRYRAELKENDPAVARLLGLLKGGRVTLLYGAHDPDHNHALVLRDFIRDRMSKSRHAG